MRRAFTVGLLITLGATVWGCAGTASTSAPAGTASTSPAARSAADPGASPAPATETAGPSPTPGRPTPTVPGSAPRVTRDDSLLAILPPSIDGTPVIAEEASFGEATGEAAFAANVEKAAFAVAAGPDDLASGVVAQLVPGVFNDTFFQDWRETYNEGACAQAGGVVGNAEAELGGRTVYIATCEGGLRVYHAWLAERGVIVSLFSLGEARYGERLMADLRP